MRLNSHSIKEQSIVGVYKSIEKSGSVSRNEIAANTGRSVVTVCKMVDLLLKNHLLTEEKDETSTVGRKAFNLKINYCAKTILILDITKKRFSSRLLYLDNQDVAPKYRYHYDKSCSFQENLGSFLEESKKNFFLSGERFEACIGIGVVVPGPYLEKKDKVVNKRLPELSEMKLKEFLTYYFPDCYLMIEEDVKLAGIYSAGFLGKRGSQSLFYAYIDEGVGGSVISNGHLSPGAHSFAGDFGQLLLTDGRTVEEKICIPHFLENIGISCEDSKSMDILFEGLDVSDKRIKEKIDELEKNVACALYNVCWLIDPYNIIIESKYCKYFPDFIQHISEELNLLLGDLSENFSPKIIEQNGIVQYAYRGAALLILNQYLTGL